MTICGAVNNAGPGYGLQYERFFEEERNASFVFPLFLCYDYAPASRSGQGSTADKGLDQRPLMVLIAPGFRYYPCGGSGFARYAVGASFLIGRGKGEGNTYTNSTNNLVKRSIFGLMVANGINFQPSAHFKLNMELGLGLSTDRKDISYTGNPLGIDFTALASYPCAWDTGGKKRKRKVDHWEPIPKGRPDRVLSRSRALKEKCSSAPRSTHCLLARRPPEYAARNLPPGSTHALFTL